MQFFSNFAVISDKYFSKYIYDVNNEVSFQWEKFCPDLYE